MFTEPNTNKQNEPPNEKEKNNMKTVQEITDNFIKDGWSKHTVLSELTVEEIKAKNLNIKKRYFKMEASGNIFEENMKIALYNL